MGLNETLIVISIILILIDIFIVSDVTTHIAFILFSFLIAKELPFSLLYQILGGILSWFIIVIVYYLFWKTTVQNFVNKFIAPDKYKAGANDLIGKKVDIKEVDKNLFVKVYDELWSLDIEKSDDNLRDGDFVEVIDVKTTNLIVRRVKKC